MKAQFWSFDVIFAIIIFTVAITILFIVWFNAANQLSLASGYGMQNMQAQLQLIQQSLLSQGIPTQWNSQINLQSTATWTNITVGLKGSGQRISQQKLMALLSMVNKNYQSSKAAVGTSYDYFIAIRSPNAYNLTIGSNPQTHNATSIQTVNLPVVLDNGAPATMSIMIWTNTTFGVS